MTIASLLLGAGIALGTVGASRADAQAEPARDSANTESRLDPAGLPGGLPLVCHTIAHGAKDSSAVQLEYVEPQPPHFVRLRRIGFDSLGTPLYAQLATMTRADTGGSAPSAVYFAVRFDGQARGARMDMKDGAFVTAGTDTAWSRAFGFPGPARVMTQAEVARAVAFAEWARTHRCDTRPPG